jgi:hypothetical protein
VSDDLMLEQLAQWHAAYPVGTESMYDHKGDLFHRAAVRLLRDAAVALTAERQARERILLALDRAQGTDLSDGGSDVVDRAVKGITDLDADRLRFRGLWADERQAREQAEDARDEAADTAERLQALANEYRAAREQAEQMPVVAAALLTKLKEECEAQHARAEQAEQERDRLQERAFKAGFLAGVQTVDKFGEQHATDDEAYADYCAALSPQDGQP